MADRNRYDEEDRERRRRNRGEGEGFFDRVSDWFTGEDRDQERDWDPDRETRWGRNRNYEQDYDWQRNRGPQYNRDRQSGQDWTRDRDWDQNQDWERTRQWRQDYDRGMNQPGRYNRSRDFDTGRDAFGDRYGQNYGRSRVYGGGQDYTEDYGRSYTQGNQRYQDYNRDWQGNRGRQGNRDWQSNRDWDYETDEYRDINRRYGRGERYGQSFGQRGQMGTYPASGMQSDFGTDFDYENREQDFGYESEGAFYQDLDEPVSYSYYEVWYIPGEFTGMGPQGYQRSDSRIHEDVCERLTQHGQVDARNVEIEVHNGEVMLKGSVPDRNMKRAVEDVAESVSGVREVRNDIRVKREEQTRGRDWSSQNRTQDRDWESRTGQEMSGQSTTRMGSTTTSSATTGSTSGMGSETTSGSMSTSGVQTSGGAQDKRKQLREGMEVLGKNGKVVGRVKEVRNDDFLVDRDMARDVYVPFEAVKSVGAQALLEIAADEVDNQDWEKPDILG